jgi:hypothetical protein
MSQRLEKESNARINKASAMRSGLAKIFKKVRKLRNFENPESDLHLAANASCIEYADTQLSN